MRARAAWAATFIAMLLVGPEISFVGERYYSELANRDCTQVVWVVCTERVGSDLPEDPINKLGEVNGLTFGKLIGNTSNQIRDWARAWPGFLPCWHPILMENASSYFALNGLTGENRISNPTVGLCSTRRAVPFLVFLGDVKNVGDWNGSKPRKNILGRQLAHVMDSKLDRYFPNIQPAIFKGLGDNRNIGIDPRSLLDFHFVQLSLDRMVSLPEKVSAHARSENKCNSRKTENESPTRNGLFIAFGFWAVGLISGGLGFWIGMFRTSNFNLGSLVYGLSLLLTGLFGALGASFLP